MAKYPIPWVVGIMSVVAVFITLVIFFSQVTCPDFGFECAATPPPEPAPPQVFAPSPLPDYTPPPRTPAPKPQFFNPFDSQQYTPAPAPAPRYAPAPAPRNAPSPSLAVYEWASDWIGFDPYTPAPAPAPRYAPAPAPASGGFSLAADEGAWGGIDFGPTGGGCDQMPFGLGCPCAAGSDCVYGYCAYGDGMYTCQ